MAPAFSATPRDGQRPCKTLAEDPGRTQPRAAYPGAAAQTRVVSMAAIRLGSWESARAFKGIICDDISEFESHMPSQAVGSPSLVIRAAPGPDIVPLAMCSQPPTESPS